MFQTHTTESDANFRYEIDEGYDSAVVLDVKDRQFALNKALQNISQLQQSLSFMINYNSQLKEQNEKLKKSQENNTQLLNKQIYTKEKEMQKLKKQHNDVVDLLEELKQIMAHKDTQMKNYEDENRKLNRIVHEQKMTIHELQDEAMNSKVMQVSSFYNSSNIEEYQQNLVVLQKQVTQLQFQLKRSQQRFDKERQKVYKLEKENSEYKKWMASLIGLNKVIDGSEKIVMKEISNRLCN